MPPSSTRRGSLSTADQTLADRDQTHSDADQTASEADQAGADRDQLASDKDQATADRDQAADPERTSAEKVAYDTSRDERAKGTFERLGNRQRRAGTARDRDLTATERDSTADERDRRGRERDARGRARDKQGRLRDARSSQPAETVSARRATLIRQLEELGARAASDRKAAASDRVRAAADRADASRERAELEAELHAAHLDELTGVYRREMGRLALSNEIDRARRGDARFVLVFVDVDNLKAVNDREGHAAGDRLLQAVAQAIRTHLRSFDPVIRYGGDEFICGLGGIDLEEAEQRFAAIRETIQAEAFVGITVGMAVLASGDTLDALTERADAAMLKTKNAAARGTRGADGAVTH